MGPALDRASRALAAGELVVFPTDTLWGLGARAEDASAVARLLRAKDRPGTQPLSAAVSSLEELETFGRLSRSARAFVRRHLPGPFTVLVRPTALAQRRLAPAVAGGRTIGLRLPDHPVARELARRSGPVVATSANRHGAPPARTLGEARRAFGGSVRAYLPARPAPSGRPSEIVDLTGARPRGVARR
ncbi:MAG TPA: L-threonylcarbamoyladenylate synthase [Thermoplasmata archaeon]|nr:L-threonylcarbamoyladenylate synthase [Thermoplasmata archaeon]